MIRIYRTKKNGIIKPRNSGYSITNNYVKYKENFKKYMDAKNMIAYDHNWKKLKIIKIKDFILITYRDKPVEYIDIYWLIRISKLFSKASSILYFWLKPKHNKPIEIKNFILNQTNWKIKDEIEKIIQHINDEKIINFFNKN